MKDSLSIFKPERRRVLWVVIFGFYSFLILLKFPQIYLYMAEKGEWGSWYLFLSRAVLAHYLWALLTLPILWFGSQVPLERGRLPRKLLWHLLFGLICSAIQVVAYTFIDGLISGRPFGESSAMLFTGTFRFLNATTAGFVFYVEALAVITAANYAGKYRDREFRLQESELQAMKIQLRPHFLFNTLNAIAALVYTSPQKATRTISQLSDLLRVTIQHNKAQTVPLKDELDFVRKYAQIQETLLGERLAIVWTIEARTLDALVPNMLVQPIVENAIRHGINPKEKGGRVEISSRRVNGELLLQVQDDGSPHGSVETVGTGIGLGNTGARLRHMYGDRHSFDFGFVDGHGWRVTIVIPFEQGPRMV